MTSDGKTSAETLELEARDGRQVEARHGWVEVGDGVTLHTLEAGAGPPLVMLPGWSQTAEMFREQLAGLSGSRRAIAVDHRGHGRSPAPAGGYRVHRLAADLEQLLRRLEFDRVDLLAHSMGASVLNAYLDLFGPERISSLVLVDQMPCALREPTAVAWALAARSRTIATPEPGGPRFRPEQHVRVDLRRTRHRTAARGRNRPRLNGRQPPHGASRTRILDSQASCTRFSTRPVGAGHDERRPARPCWP